MTDIFTLLENLRRPKILIRAARLQSADYNRETDLRFIVRTRKTPPPHEAMAHLLDREGGLEEARVSGEAGYNPHEHIRVLGALLAEARLPFFRRMRAQV